MPLPHYGVVIGAFADFTRDPNHDYGHWYHGHLQLTAPAGTYEAALDVDAPASVGVSYRLVTDLTVADIAGLRAKPDGFHLLLSTPTSGALDYLARRCCATGCGGRRSWPRPGPTGWPCEPAPGDPVTGPTSPTTSSTSSAGSPGSSRTGPGTVAAPALPLLPVALEQRRQRPGRAGTVLRDAVRLYVFGQQCTTGLGVHDVHQNQGDPLGSQWYPDNGAWQDGAVMAEQADGRVVVWQVKFNTQSLDTDDDGHPHGS